MSEFRCESHDLNLERIEIDDNECLHLFKCHECKSQLREIWTHTRTENKVGTPEEKTSWIGSN